ncbi:MAG: HAMP domain-containing histidine kinase [Butyricicoccus pullicaecorum]|nr:HAMP domain-containing histidine kinase [Butyricicoccus pullicaecorum]
MKRLSTKQKLTIWIALLMLLSVALVLGILMFISNSVIMNHTMEQLESTLRGKLSGISKENGKLVFEKGFSFVENGVYTIIYSKSGALLAGQMPLSFPDGVAFQNGIAHTVSGYHVLDFRLPLGWQDSIWVRGVIPVVDTEDIVGAFRVVGVILLPLMVIISATGAYLLSRSTFRPIDRIISAAEAIGEGRDLSRRIGLPAGRDEISRMGAAFDRMFARLETSFETEKQFTSDASHELRTPIAVILAQCEEAKLHALSQEEYAKAFDVVERQAKRMSTMIRQLLQMTRLEQGTQQVVLEEADLSELVAVVCTEQPVSEKGIVIETNLQPHVEAWFDVTLMSRLLQNLLNNAARYGRENGHIWVTLRKNGSEVTLAVRDDGIGIPSDKIDKVWQRFYQADNTRGAESGTGLGLTMVRQIAFLHGGQVTVDSIEGAGSCFTLRFPAQATKREESKEHHSMQK